MRLYKSMEDWAEGEQPRTRGKKGVRQLMVGGQNDDLATPPQFFQDLDEEFKFDFDPCPLNGLGGEYDGLKVDWGRCNYVNPPYSQIAQWIQKGAHELRRGKKSVFLITARTNTKYWYEHVVPNASEIRFLEKGLRFGDYPQPFPVPLALVIFDPERVPQSQLIERPTYRYYTLHSE